MELAAAEWKYDRLHKDRPFHDGTFPDDPEEWSAERNADTPYHHRDGVSFWVTSTDVSPHDHWLGGASCCAHCNPQHDPLRCRRCNPDEFNEYEQPDEPEERRSESVPSDL